MSGHVGAATMQRWAELTVFLLHPVRLKMPTRTVLSTRKTETADGSGEVLPGRKDYIGPMLIAQETINGS